MDDFKRKWKQENGLSSLFDKRQFYKERSLRVKSAYPTQIKPTFKRTQLKKKGLSFKVTGKPLAIPKLGKTVNTAQIQSPNVVMFLDPKSSRKS